MNQNTIKHSLLLLLTAAIWGFAFVAQSVGMDYVKPFTFTTARSLIGGVVLLPVIFYRGHAAGQSGRQRRLCWKAALPGGIICGILLCIATNLQQIGIQYTTVGKSGFITAMYIVLVPIIGIFSGKDLCPHLDFNPVVGLRSVLFVHDRWNHAFTARRFLYTLLCTGIFFTDPCRRLFCTDRGQCDAGVY